MVETMRTVLELVYFTCAPLILIVGCIGLYQLKIAKDTARLNARRDALRLAATQCDYYQRYVIPLINTLDMAIHENGIKFYEKGEVDVRGNTIRIRPNLKKDKLIAELKKLKSIAKETVEVFNALEAFAVFFTSGLADEKIAFSSLGKTYCQSVRSYLPEIFPLSQGGGSFGQIIKLFLMWNARFERQQLQEDRKEIENQLNRLSNKFIRPIGTD